MQLIPQALALKASASSSIDQPEDLPDFEIADETYVSSKKSKNTLQRELALKAFSESEAHAGL